MSTFYIDSLLTVEKYQNLFKTINHLKDTDVIVFKDLGSNVGMWYHPDIDIYGKNGNGFEFLVIDVCCPYDDDEDITYGVFSPKNLAETIFLGRANFDGIRHLYFGQRDSDAKRGLILSGYSYYPQLNKIKTSLNELEKLVKLFCKDPLEPPYVLLSEGESNLPYGTVP